MSKIIDIHTHIIPFVDDGSSSFDESVEILKSLIDEGVQAVILTPHIQSVATKANREQQISSFDELKEIVLREKLEIDLYFGAEIRYRSHLNIDYNNYVLANSKYILIEFSTYNEEPVEEVIYNLSRNGFIPIVAHIERYPYLTFDDYYKIKESGGLIQVNGEAFLGLNGKSIKRNVYKMMKNQLIDFIASDVHHLNYRQFNLRQVYNLLENQFDNNYLKNIFYNNALKIIGE